MPAVAEDVGDANLLRRGHLVQPAPQVPVLDRLEALAVLAAPAVRLPAGHPLHQAHGDVLAIRDQLDLARALERGQALDDAGQLHAVVGRLALGAPGLDGLAAGRMLEDVRPAAGAGVAAAGAV